MLELGLLNKDQVGGSAVRNFVFRRKMSLSHTLKMQKNAQLIIFSNVFIEQDVELVLLTCTLYAQAPASIAISRAIRVILPWQDLRLQSSLCYGATPLARPTVS